jgi:hypothetical protein
MYRKGKGIRIKSHIEFLSFQICVVTNLSTPSFFFFAPFFFWEKFPTAEFFNDVGRNSLLGHRKKGKFLMSTFTCRSTFLYARNYQIFQNLAKI